MTRRIAPLPKERWTSKIFDWRPGLEKKIRTRRLVGRPRRRWEDDINEFKKPIETKEEKRYDLTNNNSWMTEAKKKELKKSENR